ncbi:unnamed protein product [Didymodactylos carnosus]|uniref:Uncharacterized protein n=1 Tax=Didymodactylos carnosus TaxID=1234261 RepID=A0A815B253_9BILA|nr:unnamed protein product [Didymodactylos carnosus]CAF4040795.1 unnamed protein product [Didymodactylos carnosus]
MPHQEKDEFTLYDSTLIHRSIAIALFVVSTIDGSLLPSVPSITKPKVTHEQCATACGGGVKSMETFCPLILNPVTFALCMSFTHLGGDKESIKLCTQFCTSHF